MLPPTLNCDRPEDDFSDLDFVPNVARSAGFRAALCNGFGFGGVNATIAIVKLD